MTEKMLDMVGKKFPLKEIDTGEFATAKVGPMKFQIKCYDAEGLGRVSVMSGRGMFGLMKMDTVIINPFERDMALFSYDRIHAMGNDTIFLELYDTRIDRKRLPNDIERILEKYKDIPEQPVAPNWYDQIKFSVSLKKKGKKDVTPRFDKLTQEYLDAVLKLIEQAPECDAKEKKKAAAMYTEGLLTNGGPSTDQFVKAKGKEYTQKLFRSYLFGTE